VLVFGASGYVGSHLVPALAAAGRRVRAAARQRRVLEARGWPDVELVEADALEPDTLDAALAGIETAYYLVHSMAAGKRFRDLDRVAAANFAAAAARCAVKRIVYLGGLIPRHARSEHLLSRQETGDELRKGPVPVTELRAGIIVGPGSAAYEVMRDLVYHLPVMLTPRWVQSKSSPIAIGNLVEYLIRIADLPQAQGRVLDAGGPEYMSYEAMMREFGAVVGRRPRIVRVPLLSPRLSSYWLGLVTTVPARIARALIGGMRYDIPAFDAELRALVPQRLLTFREAVEAALAAERARAVTARWTEGALMFRGYRHDHAFYAKKATGSAVAKAPPEAVWRVLTTMGGDTGYFYFDVLWRLRAWLDWAAGGAGLSRGRRHPTDLRLGDMIDYWTVLGIHPPRRLTLHFGMRAPGTGVLEFDIEPCGDGTTRITETAYWHPAGFWGLVYWYVLVPFHLFLFAGMTKAMAGRAEALAAGDVPLDRRLHG
jgi:uncharacterized protein YbjT (DUF2867 family)/uncharacterized protein YndB with AHSA1/START domain